jgi:hypothetical protein
MLNWLPDDAKDGTVEKEPYNTSSEKAKLLKIEYADPVQSRRRKAKSKEGFIPFRPQTFGSMRPGG